MPEEGVVVVVTVDRGDVERAGGDDQLVGVGDDPDIGVVGQRAWGLKEATDLARVAARDRGRAPAVIVALEGEVEGDPARILVEGRWPAADARRLAAVGRAGVDSAGAARRVDVAVTVDARVEYLAVDIPLPAGLEAVDMSIGKGRAAMVIAGRGSFGNHEEIRRDRALVFADVLRAGRHVHTVFLRATTPGTFEMPPAVAQAMYLPELQGSSVTRTIAVSALP